MTRLVCTIPYQFVTADSELVPVYVLKHLLGWKEGGGIFIENMGDILHFTAHINLC